MNRLLVLSLLAASGCTSTTALEPVEVPVLIETPAGAVVPLADGSVATLDEAKMAFGPVYFCTAPTASPELCESAVAELAEILVVDLLAPATPAAQLRGVTDTARSALANFGITWTAGPAPTPAVAGHTLLLRGHTDHGGAWRPFALAVDIAPPQVGSYALEVPVPEQRLGRGVALHVRVDLRALLSGVVADTLVAANDVAENLVSAAFITTGAPVFTWTAAP